MKDILHVQYTQLCESKKTYSLLNVCDTNIFYVYVTICETRQKSIEFTSETCHKLPIEHITKHDKCTVGNVPETVCTMASVLNKIEVHVCIGSINISVCLLK